MKKTNLFILMLLSVILAQAQSGPVKVYGLKQQATGGMQKRGDLQEDGTFKKTAPAPVFQYTIYLATKAKTKIYPVQLWINGEAFSVKSKAVTLLPVTQQNGFASGKEKKVLIPKTAGMVLKLTPAPMILDKSGGRAKALVLQNEVVVLYKTGGKMNYGVLKKFIELEPAVLQ